MRPTTRRTTRNLLAAGAVAALVAVPAATAFADNGNGRSNPGESVTICHATHSDTNPYVVNSPNKNGNVSGHAKHRGPIWAPGMKAAHQKWGDIIPSFTYNDHGTMATFPGLNATDGAAWLANDCRVPITGTVVKSNDGNADGTFSDSETATAAGLPVTFQVVVTNTSVVPAVIGSFQDAVAGTPVSVTTDPAGVVGTTLAAGASMTFTFTVADYTPADGESVVDVVTMTLHQVDVVDNGVTLTDDSTVTTEVPAPTPPDVSVAKGGPATVTAGQTYSYTIAVTNDGTVPVSDVVVTDTLPTGLTYVSSSGTGWTQTGTAPDLTFELADPLAAGATSTEITVTVTLDAAYAAATVVNSAVVTPTDATPADNTSTVTSTVTTGGGGGGEVTPPAGGGGGGGITGGGGGTNLPFTGAPAGLMVLSALALLLSGAALVSLNPRTVPTR